MRRSRAWQDFPFSDPGLLILMALCLVVIHTLTNGQYGFHRDELATVDDARYLAWGYPAYPPVTPFIARLGMELFGPTTVGVRCLAALAQGVVLVLTGLMARELGGRRWAQSSPRSPSRLRRWRWAAERCFNTSPSTTCGG